MGADPIRQRRALKRAAKRRARSDTDETERPATAQLVSQGGRSERPPPARPSADDLLREAAWAARGKPRWIRL